MNLPILIILISLKLYICVGEGPIIQDLLVSSRLVEGKRFYLTCQLSESSSRSPISFSWFHAGQLIKPNENVAIVNTDESSQLIIKEMNLNHSGNYVCKVENDQGSDSRQVDLKLNGEFVNFAFCDL